MWSKSKFHNRNNDIAICHIATTEDHHLAAAAAAVVVETATDGIPFHLLNGVKIKRK